MSEPEGYRWKPGDQANGFILNSGGQWVPLAMPPTGLSARLSHTQPLPEGRGYWRRFGTRWWKCALILAVVGLASPFILAIEDPDIAVGVLDLVMFAAFFGLVYGTAVTFLAAAFPDRK